MKKGNFIKKALSGLLALVMLVAVMPVGTLAASASTNSYTYNAEEAVNFAESHCLGEKQLAKDACAEDWLCAEFVANCLKAGGFNVSGYTATVNAKAQGEYMQQYETKMPGNVTGKAIHDNDFVLPLKKGDLVYIVYDETVSASGHVLLYSGEKDSNGNLLFYAHNNRKAKEVYSVTGKYLEATIEMYAIVLEDINSTKAFTYSTYSAQDFVDAALAKVGTSFANGYCLRFVAQLFQATYGGAYVSSCCAYHHGNTYIDSNSRDNIPLGACVFFSGSTVPCGNTTAGHIGIYVGDDYIVHGWGGKIVKTTIDSVIKSKYPYRGWGWQANISLESTYVTNSANPDDYPVLTRDLVSTTTGEDVKWLQCVLKHILGCSIEIDGSYGPATKGFIEDFQNKYGLTVDGQVGPATRKKLTEIWASKGNTWHTWNSGTIVTAATHTSTGVKTYKCNYCEATENEIIAKLTGHTYSSWQNHDTTYHKKTCACGDVQYANHTWNSGVITTQATCTATGARTYTCSGCNVTKTESISAKGHTYSSWQNHDTTYHKKTCSCGDVQYANHTWNSGVITKDATHTETGIKTYTCRGCNTTKTEIIPKLSGHAYGAWQNHNAMQHKKICACGDVQYASHTWNSGTITKVATHTEEGLKTYTCTGCNVTKTEAIAKLLDHTYGGWVNYDETQHKHVCDCGKFELAMHDWDAGKITTPASNATEGVKTYTCLSCNATKTEKIPVLVDNHEWDEGAITKYPVCVGEGIKTYICIKCGETKEVVVNFITHDYGGWNSCNDAQHKRVCACGEIEEVAEHVWDTSFVSKKPTYTENGVKTYYCTTCGAKRTEQIPMLEISENLPQIIVSSSRTIAGGTAVVTIAIKNNPGISSLILKVEYDDSLLTLTNVQYNNAMGGQTLASADLKKPTLYWIDAFNNMNEDVVFATLTFKVEENVPVGTSTEIVVSYDANDIYNFDEENVEFSVQNGNITLFDYIPGDINGDSVVDNRDVTTLMRFFADWDIEVNEAALDVNGDDVLSNKDVSRLIQFVGGWNVEIY